MESQLTQKNKMKIGIIKEEKYPPDARVVLTPAQCAHMIKKGVDLVVERSDIRCFRDEEYIEMGVPMTDDVSSCDILLGVKEVPVEKLIPDKTYFFFSHTIKKQAYNQKLLQEILRKNIRLIDYEVLTDAQGKRVIAFGVFAGIVGAHNALWTYGQRTGDFELMRMKDAYDYDQVKKSYVNIQWPPIDIVLTGKGRVGTGAAQVLREMGIEEVSPQTYLNEKSDRARFVQIDYNQYVVPRPGSDKGLNDFFDHPSEFISDFYRFATRSDLMINGIFWDNDAPPFFTKEQMRKEDFRIRVIADVTCDIAPVSSIPSTLRATTIDDPVFGYDPVKEEEVAPFQDHVIDMMTIDNLPNELPRDASTSFGEQFMQNVWPQIEKDEFDSGVLLRGTVTERGELGRYFQYLSDFAGLSPA